MMYNVFQHDYATGPFKRWSKDIIQKQFPYFYSQGVESTEEICIAGMTDWLKQKIENQDILIIGGGPSSRLFNWNIVESQQLWTMNHFFLNEIFRHTRFDFIYCGPGLDIRNITFQNCLGFLTPPTLIFEPHKKYEFDKERNYLNYEFPGRTLGVGCITRFYSKLGVGVRMVILAAHFGCRSISFIGFDGAKGIKSGEHAFETHKALYPSGVNANNAEQVFQSQYDQFWEYMLATFPKTKYISLDKTNGYHRNIG